MTGETRLRYHGHQGVITSCWGTARRSSLAEDIQSVGLSCVELTGTTGQLNFVYTAHMQSNKWSQVM